MTVKGLIDQIPYFCDYAAIAAGLTMMATGAIGVAKAKPNGTVAGLQMVMLLFAGLALLLFSLLIYWIMS